MGVGGEYLIYLNHNVQIYLNRQSPHDLKKRNYYFNPTFKTRGKMLHFNS